MMYNAEWQKAVDFLRDQHRLYPGEYQIMEMLADALVNDYSRRNNHAYDEVIALCNTVLAECTDNAIRCKALDTLGIAYSYAGKRGDMLKTAEQMPAFRFSKEQFLLWRMQGEEGLKQRREYLAALIEQMASVLSLLAWHRHDSGEFVYSKEDRVRLLKQLVGLVELLYPDRDYQIKAQHAEFACSSLAQGCFYDGNEDEGFHWLEKACEYAICFDTYDPDDFHTSPALRGYSSGGWIMEDGCNHTACLLDGLMEDKKLDEVKQAPRFLHITARLKEYARKR